MTSSQGIELWIERVHTALSQAGDVTLPLVGCACVIYYWLGHRGWALWVTARYTLNSFSQSASRYLREHPRLNEPSASLMTGSVEVFSRSFKGDLDQGVKALEVAVICSPLLGLLGTVSGMMTTFDSLGDQSLLSQASLGVAAGISEALFSTQLGLMISIPGLLFGRLLQRRQRLLELRVDDICAGILDQVRRASSPTTQTAQEEAL